MDATRKLFYEQPGRLRAEAVVLELRGGPEAPLLVLDETIFYPEGGGQPCDLGEIALAGRGGAPGARARVEAVRDAGGGLVLHRLEAGLAAPLDARPGDRVLLLVEPERRLDYSQQHTAEHLLGAVALRLAGARVVSVHFGPERSLIDFDLPAISEEELAAIEDEADRIVAEDYTVRRHLCPPEELSSFPLRRPAPAGEEVVSVVEIDGLDYSPCCGLHLESTGALRLVSILGSERYKGMTRVYFVAGGRASRECRSASRIARGAAAALGTSTAGLAEALARESEARKAAQRGLAALERERAAAEAASAPELARTAEAAAAGREPPLAVRGYADRGAASLMETAKALAAAGVTALLASLPELTVQAIAAQGGFQSGGPSPKLGARLKAALDASGGKGGGGAASFRAVFSDAASLEAFMDAATKELERGGTAC
jgi:alanyl-tRNA synthetase